MINIEPIKNNPSLPQVADEIDFDFKPITSGLGFHQKTQEIKPVFTERTTLPLTHTTPSLSSSFSKEESNIYQSDISLFYQQKPAQETQPAESLASFTEVTYFPQAPKILRVWAYVWDLSLLLSVLALVLTVMARVIHLDLLDAWRQFPHDMTTLASTLFCGFYLIYFSIFEKTHSTFGKSLLGLRVVDRNNQNLSLITLFFRSSISLLNFISLGLFSYFDLQNKVTSSQVVRKV